MTMTAEQLELPYFIPTSENVSQILAALRSAEAKNNNLPTESALPPDAAAAASFNP